MKKIDFIKIELTNNILSRIKNKKFILDRNTCSYYYENIISKQNTILNYHDPIYFLKAVKSTKEIANMKKIHIDDGAAFNKIFILAEKNYNKRKLTEISAAQKLFD